MLLPHQNPDSKLNVILEPLNHPFSLHAESENPTNNRLSGPGTNTGKQLLGGYLSDYLRARSICYPLFTAFVLSESNLLLEGASYRAHNYKMAMDQSSYVGLEKLRRKLVT